jgi:hypothetical protein
MSYTLGSKIGNACIHPHYEMFKKGHYSDFTLKWKNTEYPVHKYVLFSESLYFQTLLKSNWMESNSVTLDLPENWITEKSFEDFLSYLYTNVITEEALKVNLCNLYYLADYFQVFGLKELVINGFKKYLKDSNVRNYLTIVCARNNLGEFKALLVKYIAARHKELSENMFPFHEIGKTMLLKIFKEIATISKIELKSHIYYHTNPAEEEEVEEEGEEVNDDEAEDEDFETI